MYNAIVIFECRWFTFGQKNPEKCRLQRGKKNNEKVTKPTGNINKEAPVIKAPRGESGNLRSLPGSDPDFFRSFLISRCLSFYL